MIRVEVLDHGYLTKIESWGSDERIIEAARMSTGKGFLGWKKCPQCGIHLQNAQQHTSEPGVFCPNETVVEPADEKLLEYLWTHKHATPFEMAGLVIEVQAPIFVFREWHRHRTQSYNEMSARYTPLPDLNYVPTLERLMMNAGGTNKQAGTVKGAMELTEEGALEFQAGLREQYIATETFYQLSLQQGVPKELARVHLPVGRYSRMRASANLRNWLAFLTLRMAPEAQWEIRQYANAVGALVQMCFPRTWELFCGDKA